MDSWVLNSTHGLSFPIGSFKSYVKCTSWKSQCPSLRRVPARADARAVQQDDAGRTGWHRSGRYRQRRHPLRGLHLPLLAAMPSESEIQIPHTYVLFGTCSLAAAFALSEALTHNLTLIWTQDRALSPAPSPACALAAVIADWRRLWVLSLTSGRKASY